MATKKTTAKSKKPAAKPAVKPAAKPVAKQPAEQPAEKKIKRVPPRIVKKLSPNAARPEGEYIPYDTAKAVAFGMNLVEQMKREAAAREKRRQEEEDNGVNLTRRPTTRAQGKATETFPEKDLNEFRKRLIAARQQALGGVNAMKATGFNESEDHEADGGDGTAQSQRLQALGQMGNIKRVIQQIDEALHRIDDGSYGVCASCGQLIRKQRLLNSPFALTCMECQSAMEREAK